MVYRSPLIKCTEGFFKQQGGVFPTHWETPNGLGKIKRGNQQGEKILNR